MGVLAKATEKEGVVNVGYQGGGGKNRASWNSKLGIWWIIEKAENRFWNAFGVGEPKWDTNSSHSIICEINFPFEGLDRRIAGAFAEDENGEVYVTHSGKIGGGRQGISKNLFETEFNGQWNMVSTRNGPEKRAIIGALRGTSFPEELARFVKAVAIMKENSQSTPIQLFISPASGAKPQTHLSKTIRNLVTYDSVGHLIQDPDLSNRLRSLAAFGVWGVPPGGGQRGGLKKLREGDIVVFYMNDELGYVGHAIGWEENPKLADFCGRARRPTNWSSFSIR